MKLTIEQGHLSAALARVTPIVPARATMPALQCVLFEASEGAVTITATDLDAEVKASCAADVTDGGSIAVPAKLLADVVKRIPKSAVIEVKHEKGLLNIKAGRIKASIATSHPDDFPRMASDEYEFTTTLDAGVIRDLFGKVGFAVSTKETQYYLRGVYIHQTDAGLTSVATDGHRLARWHCNADCDGMPGIIVPSEVVGMLGDAEGDVTMQVSSNKVRFSGGEWSLVSKVIDGTFPAYDRIIPERKGNEARFDGKAMKAAVDRAGSMLDKTSNAVVLAFDGDGVNVSGRAGTNAIEDFVEAEYIGDPVTIGFNNKYVVSAMQHLDGNAVCYVGGPLDTMRIEDDADAAWTMVLMPMRVG